MIFTIVTVRAGLTFMHNQKNKLIKKKLVGCNINWKDLSLSGIKYYLFIINVYHQ